MSYIHVAGRDEVTTSPRGRRAVCRPATWLGVEGTRSRLRLTRSSSGCYGCRCCYKRWGARTFHCCWRRTDSDAALGLHHSSGPDAARTEVYCIVPEHVWWILSICVSRSRMNSCVCWAYRTSCDRNSIECVAIFDHSFGFLFLLLFHIASCFGFMVWQRCWVHNVHICWCLSVLLLLLHAALDRIYSDSRKSASPSSHITAFVIIR